MSLISSVFIGLTFKPAYSFLPDPEARADRNYQALNVKVLNVAQTQANDNYIPYRQAQFFVNRSDPAKDSFIKEWGVGFFQRTPLMGAVTAQYFNLLGDKPPIDYTWSQSARDPSNSYLKFQIIASVLNAAFIVPAFFFLTKLFNKKTAMVTSLFLVISPFFLYNAFYSWPKSLVTFFVFTAWILIYEKRRGYLLMAGVASGLAYLTHDLSVLYIGATIVFLLYHKRFQDTVIYSVAAFLFALPWLATANLIYHIPSTFIYYPFSTNGIPQNNGKGVLQAFVHTPVLRLFAIRLESLFYLLSPYELIYSEAGQTIAKRLWALTLFSIPGGVGLGLIIPAIVGGFKKLVGLGFWILVIVPVVLCTIIIGWPKGVGALHFAEAVVVLISGLGVFYLIQLKRQLWLYAAYIVCCAQLLFFIAYSYRFALGIWLKTPSDCLRLVVITAILGVCLWLIRKTIIGKAPN